MKERRFKSVEEGKTSQKRRFDLHLGLLFVDAPIFFKTCLYCVRLLVYIIALQWRLLKARRREKGEKNGKRKSESLLSINRKYMFLSSIDFGVIIV